MRIISGKHRGRKLEAPKGKHVRPTTDRCREAVFNLLMHGFDPCPITDERVLDVCCGTGALGLEALSRGAAHATFIDSNRTALTCAEDNARTLGESPHATFLLSDVAQMPRAVAPVALVLMDAPYRSGLIASAFKGLLDKGWLKDGTLLAFEQDHKEIFPELEGCEIVKQRNYGKTRVTIVEYQRAASQAAAS